MSVKSLTSQLPDEIDGDDRLGISHRGEIRSSNGKKRGSYGGEISKARMVVGGV